jgi:hypothetical protein
MYEIAIDKPPERKHPEIYEYRDYTKHFIFQNFRIYLVC